MNLVQQQEALRTLPLPMLQMKAQGQDPSTPPWLAAAVLSERMAAQQKAGIAQGAAQGKQPSVVEQLEQKAGLMALQGQQQQQAQQQMMQQMAQAPQPAPEQVPQPEAQPEPEQMMARGGIARLPVDPRMFNYKEGGIIGFAGGGDINAALREFLRSVGMSASEFANSDSSTRTKILEAFREATQGPRTGPAVAPSALPAQAGGTYASQPAPRGLQALRSLMKPGPAAALGAGAALSYGAAQALENMSPEQRAMLENAGGGDDTAMAAAIMNAAKPAQEPARPTPPQQPPAPPAPAVRQKVDTGTVPGGGQAGRSDSATDNVRLPMSPELEAALRADAEREGIGAPVFNIREPKGARATLTPEAGLPAAMPTAQPPQPSPAQAGLPAALAQTAPDPLQEAQRFAEAMQLPPKQDLASVRALRQQALREAGLPEDVGTQLGEGISRYEAESERIRKAREKADALYVLSGRGGLGDIAARAAHRESVNALADSIRNDKANEMRTAMESARRAEAMGDVAEVRRQMDLYNKAAEERGKATVTAATALAGQRTTERGQTLQAGVGLAQIGSQENIHELDRKLREKLHNTPAAQRASVEENAIRDYMRQFNLSYADAYAKVKQVASGFKGEMTRDQATDNVKAFLESAQGSMYIREIQKKAKDAGQPIPDIYTIRKQLIEQEIGGSARSQSSAPPPGAVREKIRN